MKMAAQDEEALLRELVDLTLDEARVREADISDGSTVPLGSRKHVKDLEKRIAELQVWRDKHKRGTEKRADYTRLINRLKAELAGARRAAETKKK